MLSSRHRYIPIDDRLKQHTSLVTIDIDGLNPSEIPDLLGQLAQMPEVVLAFVSPSGVGIKVIVRVNPTPQNAQEHKGAFQGCVEFFGDLATEFGFKIDTSGSDVSRLCYLAHDPLAVVNTNAMPIEWDRDAYLRHLASAEKQRSERANVSVEYKGDVDVAALDFIDPDAKIKDPNPPELNPDAELEGYQVWILVGMACRNSGVPLEVWDTWSQRGEKYRAGECDRKWQSFGGKTDDDKKVTWATVVSIAKANGYKPKRSKRRAPVRLSQLPDYKPRSAPLETVRKLNHDGVSEWLKRTSLSIPDYEDPVKPILKRITGKKRILIKKQMA